uniref:Variant surface glycoprotein n=1 Tax=Trypanosoma brucei TaxID=5691 RepID=A0A1V0FZ39_9TRYP|nr:variant surface glycoprotein [Trypanosoma brucei]
MKVNALQAAAILCFSLHLKDLSDAATSDGINEPIFTKLCAALQLTDGQVSIRPEVVPSPVEPEDLYNLNMSIAAKEWQTAFVKSTGDDKGWEQLPLAAGVNADWSSKWSTWAKAALHITNSENKNAVNKKAGLDNTPADKLLEIRHEIAQIADLAYDTYSEYVKGKQKPDEDPAIIGEIRQSLYGDTKLPTSTADINKAFSGPANNPQAGCETGNTAPATKTLLGATFCACLTVNLQSPKLCDKHATALTWEAASYPTLATYKSLRNLCPQADQTELTLEKLESAIAGIKTIIKGSGADAYIGQLGGTCDGSNGAACIKYANAAASGATNLQKITWLSQLQKAVDKIKARILANSKAATAGAELDRLSKLAAKITTGASRRAHKQAAAPAAAKPEEADKKTAKQKECDQHKSNKTACESTGKCEWKGKSDTEGDCKPKDTEGTQAPAAGTGDGATATPSGCAKHGTDKTACENDKTGDKQNCAWRKGKDNEDDKDTEKCRNGSFLVSKQFPLRVVSAAFAALLF